MGHVTVTRTSSRVPSVAGVRGVVHLVALRAAAVGFEGFRLLLRLRLGSRLPGRGLRPRRRAAAAANRVFRVVEHLGAAIADDPGRARGAVAHRRFRLRDPLRAEDANDDERREHPGRDNAQRVVPVLQVEDVLLLDLGAELPRVRAVHLHRGATLQVPVRNGEDRDERDAADAPALRRVEREREGERDPREHDRGSDRGTDVHEEVGFGQLLRQRVHVFLLHPDDALDERRDGAHRLPTLLEEVDAHEVEGHDDEEAHPVGEPVHRRREDRRDHPHEGERHRRRVEAEEHAHHLHRAGDDPAEGHHERRDAQDGHGGPPGEAREPVLVPVSDPQRDDAVDDERADDCHRTLAHVGGRADGRLRLHERAARLEACEQVQPVEHVHAAGDGVGALVAIRLADEEELERRDHPAHEVLRGAPPALEVRAALAPVVLEVADLPHELHGGIEVRAREPVLDVVRVVAEGVEEPHAGHRRLAFQLGNDVGAGRGFDPHEAEHVEEDELLGVGVPGACGCSGERALDAGVRRHRNSCRGGGGCGRGGCGGGHEGSDSGVAGKIPPVRDDVGTGFFGGLAGHAAQHARRRRDGFHEFAQQGQHTATVLQPLSDEQDGRAGDVRDAGVEVEDDPHESLEVVGPTDAGHDFVGEALLSVFGEGTDEALEVGIAHGEFSGAVMN